MIIDYVSTAMEVADFQELFQASPKMPGQQAQKYNRLMIEGLAANGVEVHAISARPVTTKNCNRKYFPFAQKISGKINWMYGPVLIFPFIKNLCQGIFAYRAVKKDCLKNNTAVVLDVLNVSVALGASLAAKKCHKPCIGIVTDLPEMMVTGTGRSQVNLVYKIMENCTGFVFLTQAMNEKANHLHKPYTIVEALCDYKMKEMNPKIDVNSKKCIYAGLLDARYGVKNMVEGFIAAQLPDAELHLYGNGPYAEELKGLLQSHSNIIYHGAVLNHEVIKAELEATLLVNPRPTREEFTKYSFPSKNMEYMATGTPVLTTNLPGMPAEYKPYVFSIEDESVEGIARTFKQVLALPTEQLRKKGLAARQFVLGKKNNLVQSQKVIGLIQKQLEDK